MIKKPKHKKTDKQKMVDRLDVLFSEFIRKRAMKRVGGCERCHAQKASYKELQAMHFHSRRKHTVRWDERNSAGGCGGCHMYLDSHIDAKKEFAQKLLGYWEWEQVYVLAEMTTKQSPIDYTLIEIYLKQKIKELEQEA